MGMYTAVSNPDQWMRIFGVDVASEPHMIRQLLGVTGQYASVDENLTASENLWLFARLQGIAGELVWETGHRDWTRHLVDVGLDPELFRYQRAMNAGEGEAAEAFAFPSDVAFVDFLLSPAGQKLWADNGYRPVDSSISTNFPKPSNLFTIADFGGWEKANTLFDLETDGPIAKLEEATGIPTED